MHPQFTYLILLSRVSRKLSTRLTHPSITKKPPHHAHPIRSHILPSLGATDFVHMKGEDRTFLRPHSYVGPLAEWMLSQIAQF